MRKTEYSTNSSTNNTYDPSQSKKFSLGNNNLLVIVLIAISLFAGYQFATVKNLEAKIANTQGIGTQPINQGAPNQPQPTLGKQNVTVGNYPPKGDANAKVTMVAFEDFRCPFCEKLFTDVFPQLQKDYIDTGKVKLYYRNYQFLGPASIIAGNAGECANEQNKFWDFHDYMYKNQPSESDTSLYTTDKLTGVAGNLGMNTDQFRSCLDSKKYDKNVSQDLADGQKAGVNATPTVFINGQPVIGAQPYAAFKTIIDQELAK